MKFKSISAKKTDQPRASHEVLEGPCMVKNGSDSSLKDRQAPSHLAILLKGAGTCEFNDDSNPFSL
jgi:hypothetical protein